MPRILKTAAMPRVSPLVLPLALPLVLALLLSVALLGNAFAQSSKGTALVSTTPSLQGTTLQKKPFQLSALKGKVVMVMFWSTDCAVCRDKMTELRENVQGWANKPFELVLVSVDRRREDVDGYNAIVNQSVPLKQRFTQLWTGDADFKDSFGGSQLQKTQLPATFLIDKTGKLVERYNGRLPAQVWDTVADLL